MLPQVFHYSDREIRTVMIGDAPWWVAADVCSVLDLSNPTKAVSRLDDDERGLTSIQSPSGDQEYNIVNESGLYSLILGSRKAEAKKFKKWITSEVIPSIRKTGSYSMPKKELSRLELIQLALDSENQRLALAARIEEDRPKVEFHDSVAASVESVSIADFAKAVGTGEMRFFEWLRSHGYLFKEGRTNKPYQRWIEQGLFRLVERSYRDGNGETHTYFRTLITGKGQIRLASEFKQAA